MATAVNRCKFDGQPIKSRTRHIKLFCNSACRVRYFRQKREKEEMQALQDSMAMPLYTTGNTGSMVASLRKNGALHFAAPVARRLELERMQGAHFGLSEAGEVFLVLYRSLKPDAFPIRRGSYIGSGSFFRDVACPILWGTKRIEVVPTSKPDIYQLIALKTK